MDKRRIIILLVLLIIFAVLLAFFYRDIFPKKRWTGQPPDLWTTQDEAATPEDSKASVKPAVEEPGRDESNDGAVDSSAKEKEKPYVPKWKIVSWANDEDCDGKPDNACQDYEFDAAGNIIYERFDSDCNGTPERCVAVDNDSSGKRIYEREYRGCKGEPVACCSFSYNAKGEQVSVLIDNGCDGEFDEGYRVLSDDGLVRKTMVLSSGQARCSVTLFDNDGRKMRAYGLKGGCDGVPTNCVDYGYEEIGDNLAEWADEDYGCDGVPEKRTKSIKDLDGNQIALEIYKGDGLQLSYRSTQVYGPDGEYMGGTHDSDGDGNPDSCTRGKFDKTGKTKIMWTDEDCDGTWDTCRVIQYDEHGNKTDRFTDYDCDGTADANCLYRKYELH